MKRWIAGIDIGGTKIAVCLGTRSGRVLSKKVLPTKDGRNVQDSILKIQGALLELLKGHKLRIKDLIGIGVAVPGAIGHSRESILKAPNLRTWEGYPLKKALIRKFGTRVELENDANACALAEAYFGLGRGISDFIYITISTGIGSGIVAGGSLIRGASGMAGEVGHMTVVPDGLRCPCGKNGCLEAYASGTAIAGHVRRALRKGVRSRFFKGIRLNEVTGQMVSQAACRFRDPIAIQARGLAADFLGIGIANLVNLFNPRRIILGGGVMEETGYFWTPMMKAVKREAWPWSLKACQVVRSKLGRHVGDLGAMALALEG